MEKLALCYAIFLWAGFELGERGRAIRDWEGEEGFLRTLFADLI